MQLQITPYPTLPATMTVKSDGIYSQRYLLVLLVPLCIFRDQSLQNLLRLLVVLSQWIVSILGQHHTNWCDTLGCKSWVICNYAANEE